jgi:hypothetical protein
VTTTTGMDLGNRERIVALLLSCTGYHARNVHTVISDEPLPDCEWCITNEFACPADHELFHDQGSVPSCQHCLITAASVAAENSRYGEFSLEITERPAKEYTVEAGLENAYGAYVQRNGGEWSRYYVDLDDLSSDLA